MIIKLIKKTVAHVSSIAFGTDLGLSLEKSEIQNVRVSNNISSCTMLFLKMCNLLLMNVYSNQKYSKYFQVYNR